MWVNMFIGFLVKKYGKPAEEVMMTPPQPDDFVDFSQVAVYGINQLKAIGTPNATT